MKALKMMKIYKLVDLKVMVLLVGKCKGLEHIWSERTGLGFAHTKFKVIAGRPWMPRAWWEFSLQIMKGIRAGGVYLKVISKDIGDKTRRVAEVIEKEMKRKVPEIVSWRNMYIKEIEGEL